jgi:hypothetical protein
MKHASRFARLASAAALIAAFGVALAAGPGYGGGRGGPGSGPCDSGYEMGHEMGHGMGHGMGYGMGHGPGCGPGPNGAVPSSLMTREEWIEHRNTMHGLQSYDECKAYVTEFGKLMQERAKEKGTTAPGPNESMCERMRERGLFK